MSTLYLHEIVETVPGQEERYMTSVLSNSERGRWLGPNPPARDDKRPIQVGLFRTAEVSGRWPKVVNMWGDRTWDQFIDNFELQFAGDSAALEDWWLRNLALRRQGYDRILMPAPYSPSIDDHMKNGTKGGVFVHTIDFTRWGEAANYIARMGSEFLPAAKKHGWELIGAYRIGFRPREVLSVWGMPRWSSVGALLSSEDPAIRAWAAYRDSVVTRCEEMVMLPGRINPLYQRAE
jgi:hypothetical protein